MTAETKRPMEGWYLCDALKTLAQISPNRGQHRDCPMQPLAGEEIATGAGPRGHDQIAPHYSA